MFYSTSGSDIEKKCQCEKIEWKIVEHACPYKDSNPQPQLFNPNSNTLQLQHYSCIMDLCLQKMHSDRIFWFLHLLFYVKLIKDLCMFVFLKNTAYPFIIFRWYVMPRSESQMWWLSGLAVFMTAEYSVILPLPQNWRMVCYLSLMVHITL